MVNGMSVGVGVINAVGVTISVGTRADGNAAGRRRDVINPETNRETKMRIRTTTERMATILLRITRFRIVTSFSLKDHIEISFYQMSIFRGLLSQTYWLFG